ncbi:response regulator [Streptacidiphilus sp. PAMC 29251]
MAHHSTPTAAVLLVEDDAADALLIRDALQDHGLARTITHVTDGVAVLEHLREPAGVWPDLIVLDWNMPRMGGRELLETLKSDPTFQSIPVVVLTTSGASLDVVDSYQRHANAYVTKPLNLDDFITVVTRIDDFWTG